MKKFVKYPFLVIFNSSRCEFKISKHKEKRLKEIIIDIRLLEKEMQNIFKEKIK